jgi:threonine dehydrogenase-like Zn-dependent dehydrogenase
VVDAVGSGVDDLREGDAVAFLSDKSYAEYDTASADQVVQLPDELRDREFPGEPLGCAMNIFNDCEIQPGETVAVVGAGFLGTLLTGMAHQAGARVIALARRDDSLEQARRAGADTTIRLDDHWQIIEQVKDLTGGDFCDCVIEATGKPWPLDLAAELTGEKGWLVVAGFHQDGPRQINMQLWNWRGLTVINTHWRDPADYIGGIRSAVEAVRDERLDPRPLFTHRYALNQLDEALEAARQRPAGFMKGLVVMGATP